MARSAGVVERPFTTPSSAPRSRRLRSPLLLGGGEEGPSQKFRNPTARGSHSASSGKAIVSASPVSCNITNGTMPR